MAGTFLFELVSPEKLLFSQQIEEVQLPGSEGYLTVMNNHSPLMANIVPGVIKVKSSEGDLSFVVFGGFADITPQGCSILAESAVKVDEYNIDDLEKCIEHARQAMNGATSDEVRNKAEDFFHQLATVRGVLTVA